MLSVLFMSNVVNVANIAMTLNKRQFTWCEANGCQFALQAVGAGVEQAQVRPQTVQLTILSTQTVELLSRQKHKCERSVKALLSIMTTLD